MQAFVRKARVAVRLATVEAPYSGRLTVVYYHYLYTRMRGHDSVYQSQSRSILEHTSLTGRSMKSYSDGDNRDAGIK